MRLASTTSFSNDASFGVTMRRRPATSLDLSFRFRFRRRRRNPKHGKTKSAAATEAVTMTGSCHDVASFSWSLLPFSGVGLGSVVASGRTTSADSEDVAVTPVSGGRAMPPSAMARDNCFWNWSSVAFGGSSKRRRSTVQYTFWQRMEEEVEGGGQSWYVWVCLSVREIVRLKEKECVDY